MPSQTLTRLCDASSPQQLVESLEALEIDDLDWAGDLQQISDAWRSFIDRTPQSARSFTEFRYHIVRYQRGNPLDLGVRLLTVHKAQGSEFKSVAVVACNDGQFPDFRAYDSEALAEEYELST
ncbi:MAG: hypothetical protein OXI96_06470 [Acidimicrobiaceae bacterium]|nr:hypothetical protein [Acidimicrobiaceae bacterium]